MLEEPEIDQKFSGKQSSDEVKDLAAKLTHALHAAEERIIQRVMLVYAKMLKKALLAVSAAMAIGSLLGVSLYFLFKGILLTLLPFEEFNLRLLAPITIFLGSVALAYLLKFLVSKGFG